MTPQLKAVDCARVVILLDISLKRRSQVKIIMLPVSWFFHHIKGKTVPVSCISSPPLAPREVHTREREFQPVISPRPYTECHVWAKWAKLYFLIVYIGQFKSRSLNPSNKLNKTMMEMFFWKWKNLKSSKLSLFKIIMCKQILFQSRR